MFDGIVLKWFGRWVLFGMNSVFVGLYDDDDDDDEELDDDDEFIGLNADIFGLLVFIECLSDAGMNDGSIFISMIRTVSDRYVF